MLSFDHLVRVFGDVRALDELSFAVPPGRVFGFLGPNGAGKTTTMRAVFGLTALDGGVVRWDGRPLTPSAARRFGYLPEERGLYPSMTVGRQLRYLGRLHGLSSQGAAEATDKWLAAVGLSDRVDAKVQELSLGNQQRVQLAGCLLHDPEVLILDEPFSGLDPVAVDTFSAVLADVAAAGATVLFSSHQLDLVEGLCDHVAIINRGRLVAEGAVDDLTRGPMPRLVVRVAGTTTWVDALPETVSGVALDSIEGDTVHLRLLDGADPQRVLDAARAAGSVEHFGFERLRLSEVFREAVSE
ncbi:MAG TPA: ATP-binding cassette domain-containing protein [Microthrixaceae bacterium]|nr:ATP-binding cassette domain-containing protein [Microthrixaceae bacterium]